VRRRNLAGVTARGLMLFVGAGLCLAPVVASPRRARSVNDFETRVAKYLDLRKNQAGSAPRPTNNLEKLADTQQTLAAKVSVLRQDAKQGDIFTPEIAAYFRHQIAATLKGRHGHKIRASLRHAEPVPALPLQVNQVYPQGVPLQSTPPTLLLNLPPLPKELEYRIVGRNLVLHDIVPNIVVDFISDAIPSAED
jgi:hypothetical protein